MKFQPVSQQLLRQTWGLITILVLALAGITSVYAQTYQVNGDAVNAGGGLVRLTTSAPAVPGTWQVASAWSTTKHDLTQPFDMTFDMFFGCENGPNGGDGITFTFQNAGINALGAGGGYLGLGGGAPISPAISIEFDTYDGTSAGGANEIPADHIAIDVNGDVNNTNNFFIGSAGTSVTVQPIASNRDLEDCAQNSNNYYTIRVVWNPTAKTLQLYEEGVLTMTYTRDLVNTIFGGATQVYWGFTAATGSASNEQWIAPHNAVIPWECSANSCCTPFTPTKTGGNLICTNPVTLGLSGSYLKYTWSNGATTSTISTSTPGTYTVNVIQMQGASQCPGKATFNIGTSGATATLSGSASICNDGVATTPLSVALTGTPPWTLSYAIDGVTQTPQITGITASPYIIQGKSVHTYSLVATSDNSGCNGSVSGTATVSAYTGLPIGHNNTFTTPNSTILSVDNGGGTYEWYDAPTGGALVGTGTTFTTPTGLTADKTYYVRDTSIPSFITKSVAYVNNNAYGAGGNNTQVGLGLPKAVLYMNVTPTENFTLLSVKTDVNITASPQAAGTTVSVTIQDNTNGALSTTVNVPISGLAVGTRTILVNLNYNILATHTYTISYEGTGSAQGIIYYDFVGPRGGWTGPGATITKDPELSIKIANQGQYPGIFDWQISKGSVAASCGRTPVTAIRVVPLPVSLLYFKASFQSPGNVLVQWVTAVEKDNQYFTVQRSVDGIHFTDVAIVQGAGTSNRSQQYHTYDANALFGVSYYRLKQTDFNGTFTYSSVVAVNSDESAFSFNVYPNPATTSSEVFVNITGAEPDEKMPIYIYDVLGRVLFFGNLQSDDRGTLNTLLTYFSSGVEPGTYIVSLNQSVRGTINQKIIVY